MKTVFSVIGLTLVSLLPMASCTSKKPEAKSTEGISSAPYDSPKVREEIVRIVNTLPDNQETVELINSTGAAYLAGFTGEDMKTENLLTRADKAKAYGTIVFDLVYTHTYNQTESFSKLVKIYETLTRELGFEELAESQKEFKNRYQENKNNSDSVDFLVTEMMSKTNDFIQKNGSASDISLVFAGAVIKSLNVISYLTLFAPEKDKLIAVLQKQKELINGTCMILEKSPADAAVTKVYQQLVPVNTIFNSTDSFTVQTIEQINKLTDPASAR